jgi:hypothetical protein
MLRQATNVTDHKETHVKRRGGCGGRDNSIASLLGVASRVGGVDCSDRPDEPAVEGLGISTDSRVFLLAERFRDGMPSGQVHYTRAL